MIGNSESLSPADVLRSRLVESLTPDVTVELVSR